MSIVQKLAIKQGYPKRRTKIKRKLLKNQLLHSLNSNYLNLEEPYNATYGVKELQIFFHALVTEHASANLALDTVYDKFGYNLADQQTVKERCEKTGVEVMEKQLNKMLIVNALKLPTYDSDYKLAKVKKWNTERRRKTTERRENNRGRDDEVPRLRQRERNIDPPQGRYLSMDFTLKPFYPKSFEYYNENDLPLAEYLTRDRRKRSTTKFLGYHTVYDHELGSRQILGVHMLRNVRRPKYKHGWKREGLDYVVQYLLDPILEKLSVQGLTADGDYFNKAVVIYLESKELDYVIRANKDDNVREIIENNDLNEILMDGEGFEVEAGQSLGSGKKAVPTRLVIVKRGEELVPLILPSYSELTPEQALLVYEERFGIETAYREVYNYLPRTSSISPEYRLALYAMTCWFFNILLNYYQIVVIFSAQPTDWHTSLSRLKNQIEGIFGDLLRRVVDQS